MPPKRKARSSTLSSKEPHIEPTPEPSVKDPKFNTKETESSVKDPEFNTKETEPSVKDPEFNTKETEPSVKDPEFNTKEMEPSVKEPESSVEQQERSAKEQNLYTCETDSNFESDEDNCTEDSQDEDWKRVTSELAATISFFENRRAKWPTFLLSIKKKVWSPLKKKGVFICNSIINKWFN